MDGDGSVNVEAGELLIPRQGVGPRARLAVRIGVALAVIAVTTLLVWLERDGYRDVDENGITLIDALYYSTVTLSTTGYGDITPFSESARLVNILVITPLRFLFLIVLIGTTVEQLTASARMQRRIARWRKTVTQQKKLTVVFGYGVKGRSAVKTLINTGTPKSDVVIVDLDKLTVKQAVSQGFNAIEGDGRRDEVLRAAEVSSASAILVCPESDEAAIMLTLAARRVNKTATIVVSAREGWSADILRQSGADSVITTAESAGNMMGLAIRSRHAGEIVEDILEIGRGLEVVERDITRAEFGHTTTKVNQQGELVLAVIRKGTQHSFHEFPQMLLENGDRVVVIRQEGTSTEPTVKRTTP